MKMWVIKMAATFALCWMVSGCGDSSSASAVSTSSLELPEQLEVVTNESE
ncbi:hypothetical protein [Vibrio sp. TRT 17S01]